MSGRTAPAQGTTKTRRIIGWAVYENKTMKARKIIMIGALAATLGLGVTAGVMNGNFSANNVTIGVKADAVNFATATVTRRFYFVVNKYWASWNGGEMYVHLWNGDKGSLDADVWTGAARELYHDYGNDNQGLWCVDVQAKGVGSTLYAQVKSQNGSSGEYYSAPLLLPSLASKTSDVIYLNDGTNGDGNRNSSLGTAGGTSGFVAVILEHIMSCSDSCADGYNAYPQLNADFLTPSSGEITAYGAGPLVDDFSLADYEENERKYAGISPTSDLTNVTDKIARLDYMYTNYGWTAA